MEETLSLSVNMPFDKRAVCPKCGHERRIIPKKSCVVAAPPGMKPWEIRPGSLSLWQFQTKFTPGMGDTCINGSYEQHGFPRKDLHSGSAYLFH